jgi:transcriptional regulator GlxA family with amidase domain
MSRRIVFVIFDGVQSLDLAGPLEVFTTATRLPGARAPRYEVQIAAQSTSDLTTSSRLTVRASVALRAVRGPIDTLVIPGGEGTRAVMKDRAFLAAIRRLAARSRRVASVCTGAFVLAAAGLLDGRSATTHWAHCDGLRRAFPHVRVEADPIFLRDGSVWTSAGVTSGMDLALALVEADHGSDLAREVARWLVMYLQRPGGQSQFSAPLAAKAPSIAPMRDLSAWMREHLERDLSVSQLARRARMSERNFARVFSRELGETPAAYVEALRVEAARQALQATSRSLDEIAHATGFGTVETLHRTFRRALGITPGAYRRRFATTEGESS